MLDFNENFSNAQSYEYLIAGNFTKASKSMCSNGEEYCWSTCMEAPSCGSNQQVSCDGHHLYCVQKEKPDCNYFLKKCSELCNNNVAHAECWGDPLYTLCKATYGTVYNIPGFTCQHSNCP